MDNGHALSQSFYSLIHARRIGKGVCKKPGILPFLCHGKGFTFIAFIP